MSDASRNPCQITEAEFIEPYHLHVVVLHYGQNKGKKKESIYNELFTSFMYLQVIYNLQLAMLVLKH